VGNSLPNRAHRSAGLRATRKIAGPGARVVAPLAALALGIVLATSAAISGCAQGPETPPVERVILVGVDGLDWKIVTPLIESGRMPNLARLAERGADGPLETLLPTYSPIVWASVATGKVKEKHGIDFFGKQDSAGNLTPYTSNSRQAQALWNILSRSGLPVAVVGWWNTWPAEAVEGVMVSDRAVYTRFNLWFSNPRFGEDLPRQTHPPELFAELAPLTAVPDESYGAFLDRFIPKEERREPSGRLHDPAYELFLVQVRDAAYARILRAVLEKNTPAFTAVYMNGVDIASHYFWKHRFPDSWDGPVDPGEIERYRDVIDAYAEYVDGELGWLFAQASEDTVVIVVSDHGFQAGRRSDSPHISGTHFDSAPPGVIVMAGGPVESGSRIEQASVYDIAPSVLHLLGLAVGDDMDGRVLPAVMQMPGYAPRPVKTIPSWETGAPERQRDPIRTEHDDAIVRRLRALGYLDEPEETNAPDPRGTPEPGDPPIGP
jgi:hypothetical protein